MARAHFRSDIKTNKNREILKVSATTHVCLRVYGCTRVSVVLMHQLIADVNPCTLKPRVRPVHVATHAISLFVKCAQCDHAVCQPRIQSLLSLRVEESHQICFAIVARQPQQTDHVLEQWSIEVQPLTAGLSLSLAGPSSSHPPMCPEPLCYNVEDAGPHDLAELRSFLHFSKVNSLILRSKGSLRSLLDVVVHMDHLPDAIVTLTTRTFAPISTSVGTVHVTVTCISADPVFFEGAWPTITPTTAISAEPSNQKIFPSIVSPAPVITMPPVKHAVGLLCLRDVSINI